MRDRTAGLDSSAAGDWVSQKFLESAIFAADEGARRRPDRAAVLRPARLRPRRTPTSRGERFYVGRRHVSDEVGDPMVVDWRAPDQPGVLPGQPRRADGRRAAPPVRLPARRDDRLRGRGRSLRTRPAERALGDPRGRDRAAPRRPDARHRRHHPARAGRHRPRRPGPVGLRAGRARHRQDRGRAAPGGVPALLAPRPALPAGRAGGRAERVVPALHRRRAPGARRDRRAADHDRGARRQDPGPAEREVRRPRHRRPGRRRPSRATPGWPRSLHRALWSQRAGARPRACSCRAASRRWRLAPYEVEEIGRRAARPRGPVRRRPRACSRSGSRTASW